MYFTKSQGKIETMREMFDVYFTKSQGKIETMGEMFDVYFTKSQGKIVTMGEMLNINRVYFRIRSFSLLLVIYTIMFKSMSNIFLSSPLYIYLKDLSTVHYQYAVTNI